jgi:hypothetical protein
MALGTHQAMTQFVDYRTFCVMADALESIRHQILALAKRVSARVSESTPEHPCRWRPNTVKHPESGYSFTNKSAWEFVVELLESNHPIEEVTLKQPPGRKGYVMFVELGHVRPLYIKLQLGTGAVIGRSFHYSETEGESHE